jgi:hypothetical protein
MVRENW